MVGFHNGYVQVCQVRYDTNDQVWITKGVTDIWGSPASLWKIRSVSLEWKHLAYGFLNTETPYPA